MRCLALCNANIKAMSWYNNNNLPTFSNSFNYRDQMQEWIIEANGNSWRQSVARKVNKNIKSIYKIRITYICNERISCNETTSDNKKIMWKWEFRDTISKLGRWGCLKSIVFSYGEHNFDFVASFYFFTNKVWLSLRAYVTFKKICWRYFLNGCWALTFFFHIDLLFLTCFFHVWDRIFQVYSMKQSKKPSE